ncbi:MAG: NTP/NDP exchange transporter [Pseudohongiellaceae bacterium]
MKDFIQKFTNIHREEVPVVIASGFFFFCLLTALMLLRPAREALGMESGLDTVRWLFLGTAVFTLLVNPVFGYLVSHFKRFTFVATTYFFFAASLLVFYLFLTLAPESIGQISGRIFYVWYSVFNLFNTMVFWATMADTYKLEQSKRLYGTIAVGGTLGAIFGPWLTSVLAIPIGTANLLLISVFFLFLGVFCAWLVFHFSTAAGFTSLSVNNSDNELDKNEIIGGSAWQGLRSALSSPYLLGISGYVLIIAIVGTFLYFTRLAMVAAVGDDTDLRTTMFAQIDLITQMTTLVLQLIVTGHIMRRLGVSIALAILPIVVIFGMIGLTVVGTLATLVIFEAIYRAIQRAVMRPARETLYTVVSKEEKYKAKAFIDTFVFRGGDVVGAWTEGLITRLGMGLFALAAITIPMAIVWAALGVWLGLQQSDKAGRQGSTQSNQTGKLNENGEVLATSP